MSEASTRVAADALQRFASGVFQFHELSREHAEQTARCLVRADLRGVGTHGVARIPIYTDRLRRGLVNPRPALRLEALTPVAARLDGDNGMGFVVAARAMDEAITRARDFGIGLLLVQNSTHFGMAASYLLQAIDAGFAAFVFTNASPAMPVWGGKVPFLGTSPFAFGAPGGHTHPRVVLDMATSVAARGKIRRAMQRGESIPEGWALDASGRPTTNAKEGYDGLILPLGGPKGSGLSLMMEVLAGVMSGAAFGGEVGNQYIDFDRPQNVGHMMIALRPDLAMTVTEYRARMDDLLGRAAANPRVDPEQEILMPGEPEARLELERLEHGIPLSSDELDMLRAEGERAHIAFPW